MTVQQVYNAINAAADFSLAREFDNVGLLVGDPNDEVKTVLVALDATDAVIDEAVMRGANLIVTHHPVIYEPMKHVTSDTLAWKLVRAGISVISAHTNLDVAHGGVNDGLAELLELQEITMIGDPPGGIGMGRAGKLKRGMTPPEFAYYAKQMLGAQAVRYCDGGRAIEHVAVVGGSGSSELDKVAAMGCEAYVTGDVKHKVMLEAVRRRITVIDAGHHLTENVPATRRLLQVVGELLGADKVSLSRSGIDPTTTI